MGLATFCDETELGLILLIIKANCFKVQMQVIGPVLCAYVSFPIYKHLRRISVCICIYCIYKEYIRGLRLQTGMNSATDVLCNIKH